MALAVSLRRTLLVLLTVTIFILMILYWNQNRLRPQISRNSFKNYEAFSNRKARPNSMPVENIWTYKCEGDKCVRYHYVEVMNVERRVPFLTCTMTCGNFNVWPIPTIKSVYSSKSVKFSLDALQLQITTPFVEVEDMFRTAFHIFLNDLRQIQHDYPDARKSYEKTAFKSATTHTQHQTQNDDDVGSKRQQNINDRYDDQHNPNNEGLNAIFLLAKAFSPYRRYDIDNFNIQVTIQKFANLHIDLDTDESYHINSSYQKHNLHVHIVANSFFGARHALSTLQQLIWYDDADNCLRTLMNTVVIDAPKFRYRGLMLDTSRHYFSVEAIKRVINGMALSKLNRFHWHITDSQSFPYISKHYPELAEYGAYSDSETYTADDIKEIVEYSRVRGVQIITEIDAPAHAGNGWDWGPKHGMGELSLCINQQPWSFYCGEPPCGQLNPKNNFTYLILQKLYEEMLTTTGPTDYFHLGGDEVNLECWSQYFNDTDLKSLWCDFMLNATNRLKIANNNVLPKFIAVWSSGLTNTKCLNKNQFTIQVWGGSSWQENYDLIDNGFNVIFSHVDAWYLDCGFGNWRASGEGACSPYRTWQNVYKHRPWERMRLDKQHKKQILGGEVCLWTEQVDEGLLDSRLWPRSAALAERLWSDTDDEHEMDVISQDVFNRMSIFRSRLVELGLKPEPIFPKYCAQNIGECI